MNYILRAISDLSVQHGRLFDVSVDTHIADGDFATEVLAKGGCAGFVPGQINGLLQSYRLGRTGHSLVHNSVVGSSLSGPAEPSAQGTRWPAVVRSREVYTLRVKEIPALQGPERAWEWTTMLREGFLVGKVIFFLSFFF